MYEIKEHKCVYIEDGDLFTEWIFIEDWWTVSKDISIFFSNLCVIFLYKGNSVCKCHKEIAMGQEQIEAKSGCTTYRIHLFFHRIFFFTFVNDCFWVMGLDFIFSLKI